MPEQGVPFPAQQPSRITSSQCLATCSGMGSLRHCACSPVPLSFFSAHLLKLSFSAMLGSGAMFPLIFHSLCAQKILLCNILPGLICIWNVEYKICAKTFLEGTFRGLTSKGA